MSDKPNNSQHDLINPVSGLPMIAPSRSAVDVDGNEYGNYRFLSPPDPPDWPDGSTLDLGFSLGSDW
jgi:hypothetical protein